MYDAGCKTGLGHWGDLSLTARLVQRRRERFNRRQADEAFHAAGSADLEGWLASNPTFALLGIGGLHVLERHPLFEAGSERSLVKARQCRSELLQPGHYCVAAGDFPLTLEEQLVHLPELPLQPGAGSGLGGADTALAKVEHGTEDEFHLSLAHIFIYDDRFYR